MNSKIKPVLPKPASLWVLKSTASGLALALVLTPFLFPPCSGSILAQSPMHCQNTFQVEFLLAVLSVLTAGGLWLVKTSRGQSGLGAVLAILGILAMLVPQSFFLGLCRNPNMPCHQGYHWLWLWAGIQIPVSLAIILASRERIQDGARPDPWEDRSPDLPKETPVNPGEKSCCD
jgi:hypothetical protein